MINNLPSESSLVDFLSPKQWWSFAFIGYKVAFIILLCLFVFLLYRMISKKISAKNGGIFIFIIFIVYGFMMNSLKSDAIISPLVLDFNPNNENSFEQKEIIVMNKEERPKYSLYILLDIDKLDFSQIHISIPEEYTIPANEFNIESNDVLTIFNIVHNDKKYIMITKRKINNGFSINILAKKGKVKVKETKFSYDDPGININENNKEAIGKISEFKNNKDQVNIVGFIPTLMKK
jgi:hypothetical protein